MHTNVWFGGNGGCFLFNWKFPTVFLLSDGYETVMKYVDGALFEMAKYKYTKRGKVLLEMLQCMLKDSYHICLVQYSGTSIPIANASKIPKVLQKAIIYCQHKTHQLPVSYIQQHIDDWWSIAITVPLQLMLNYIWLHHAYN